MDLNKKIGVIALGRLGLAFSLLCDSKGFNVVGYEINQQRKEQIANKTLKASEPQVEELLKTSKLKLANSLQEVLNHSDLIFILVATPSNLDGSYNHEQVENIIKELETLDVKDKTVAISCTVMPTYCKSIQERLPNLNILYQPEFIQQGDVLNGLKYADIVLIGGNPPQKLLSLYKDIMEIKPNFKILSLTGAEIAKIAINCYLTLKISYGNMVGRTIIESGEEENIDKILETIGSDSRIGNKYLKYGFPSGGICLNRDQKALGVHINNVGLSNRFITEVDVENNSHTQYLKKYFIKKNPDKHTAFIFSYITYKPNIDILVDSKQLELCLELLREGYTIGLPNSSKSLDLPKELLDFHMKGMVLFGEEYGYKVN